MRIFEDCDLVGRASLKHVIRERHRDGSRVASICVCGEGRVEDSLICVKLMSPPFCRALRMLVQLTGTVLRRSGAVRTPSGLGDPAVTPLLHTSVVALCSCFCSLRVGPCDTARKSSLSRVMPELSLSLPPRSPRTHSMAFILLMPPFSSRAILSLAAKRMRARA